MKRFINTPNLPENAVTDVIASAQICEKSLDALNKLGINLIKTMKHPELYDAVAYHADMQLHYLGMGKFICEPSVSGFYKSILPGANICTGSSISGKYPHDIAYNAAQVGKYLICNRRYTDNMITENAERAALTVIDVKQGYAKCNICIVSANALITSDKGIAAALRNFEIDVLLTDDNSVRLKGLNHGFLGGATGKIAPDKLALNGNIKYHKNCDEIINFAKKYDVEIISLNDDYIEDIGSILPIQEKMQL